MAVGITKLLGGRFQRRGAPAAVTRAEKFTLKTENAAVQTSKSGNPQRTIRPDVETAALAISSCRSVASRWDLSKRRPINRPPVARFVFGFISGDNIHDAPCGGSLRCRAPKRGKSADSPIQNLLLSSGSRKCPARCSDCGGSNNWACPCSTNRNHDSTSSPWRSVRF